MMKSEKCVTVLLIGMIVILCIMPFYMLGKEIKRDMDYGVREGQVVDKKYHSAYTTIIYTCKMAFPQYYPEKYTIKIQKEIDQKIKSLWIEVEPNTYYNINIGNYYKKEE